MIMSDDQRLLARVADGDQDALRELYARYHPRLWRYLWYQLGGNEPMAEEVLQDVFLAVWRSARKYRGEAQVATWIFRIAHFLATNARRDQARRFEGHFAHAFISLDGPAAQNAIGANVTDEDAIVSRVALTQAIEQLSPKHQEVLILLFYHGFISEEIAQILDIPSGTVRSRISYARRALWHALEAPAATEETHS